MPIKDLPMAILWALFESTLTGGNHA